MPQHIDIGDRLTTVSEHHRGIGQDLATGMDRNKRAPGHGLGQVLHQPCPLRQQPQRDAAGVSDYADTIAGN
ncbi:hypothetical protein [Propioniciclava flava]